MSTQFYDCTFNYLNLTESHIRFSILHLIQNKTQNVQFEELNYNEPIETLQASELNPNLPFVFFVNGYNYSKWICVIPIQHISLLN